MTWLQTLIGALLAGTTVAAITGFIARESLKALLEARIERLKHDLGITAKTRELAISSQIQFKERQLSELYGPIYARLKRGRPIFDLWIEGRLEEIRSQLIPFFMKTNDEVVELLMTKSHLIDGESIPASFLQYLTHVVVWHAYFATNQMGVPFSKDEFPQAFYPTQFEDEVFRTTERLKQDLYALYQQLGLPAQP